MKITYLAILTIFLVFIVNSSTAFALSSVSIDKAPYPPSPLMQFKSGVPAYLIACNDLKLVIKKSDNTPACVKPQNVQNLLVRGWGTLMSTDRHQTSNASSVLRLDLSVKNDTIKSGQSVGMEISLVNTLSKPIEILEANDWPNNYLTIGVCSPFYPIGISILKGYHTEQNMTGITPLSLYSGHVCIFPQTLVPSYTFQPLSNKTTPACEFMATCPQLIVIKSQLSYEGYFDNNEHFHPFDAGTYTIVGGDEWGHIAIQYFKVINSTRPYAAYDQPITVQTHDFHGTIKDIRPSMTLSELTYISTGVQTSRGGGLNTYDNDNIKLELDYGKISDSQVISATVENLGNRTIHIYGINISGLISIANDNFMGKLVLLDDPNIIPKDNAILKPGESQTKYIIGNWTMKGKPVNRFSAGALYSYDNLQNYDGMTNGYSISLPVQWIR
jgi:hypothetical protein